MKNLTYEQLIELAPKDRPFQIETESGPNGYNESIITWARINPSKEEELETWYGFDWLWKHTYKGTFTLIDPRYQRPEVLKAGQKVRIIEDNEITNTGTIYWVYDNLHKGLCYDVEIDNKQHIITKFPHYCVMPVEKEETPERTLEDILSELSDTDKEIIISKLK
jgi:hypothetical protein